MIGGEAVVFGAERIGSWGQEALQGVPGRGVSAANLVESVVAKAEAEAEADVWAWVLGGVCQSACNGRNHDD